MTPTLHDAVRAAYPTAATISGNDAGSLTAFDVKNKAVVISSSVALAKLEELKADFELSEVVNKAKELLKSSDWATLSDIASGSPSLSNQAEFIAYRQALRGIVINPTTSPVWPTVPNASWSE